MNINGWGSSVWTRRTAAFCQRKDFSTTRVGGGAGSEAVEGSLPWHSSSVSRRWGPKLDSSSVWEATLFRVWWKKNRTECLVLCMRSKSMSGPVYFWLYAWKIQRKFEIDSDYGKFVRLPRQHEQVSQSVLWVHFTQKDDNRAANKWSPLISLQ